jgi:drug/metabolite transporter (DMT)-like permease
MKSSKNTLGVFFAIGSGICFALSGTFSKYLFTNYEVSAVWIACVRLLVSGAILFLSALPRHRRQLGQLLRSPRDLAALAVYGLCGVTLGQFAYLSSVFYTNAGTTAVLQKLNLVILMVYVCLRERRKPTRTEAIALILALIAVFLLATGGNPTRLILSPQGLFWGLATAVAAAIYTLTPRGLFLRWNRSLIVGLGMLLGGVVVNLGARSWTIPFSISGFGWAALAVVVLFGTVCSFTFYGLGVQLIGPVKCSMLNVSDPFVATLLSVFWLHAKFRFTDYIALAAIISVILLLSRPSPAPAPEPER